jgi:hypothetical protein
MPTSALVKATFVSKLGSPLMAETRIFNSDVFPLPFRPKITFTSLFNSSENVSLRPARPPMEKLVMWAMVVAGDGLD